MIDLKFVFNISRDVAMATNFVLYWTFSLGAEVSQDPHDRFSQSLDCMVGIKWQMINPTFFFRYLKGRCHGNQFIGKNWAKLPTPCTYRSVIRKIMVSVTRENQQRQPMHIIIVDKLKMQSTFVFEFTR